MLKGLIAGLSRWLEKRPSEEKRRAPRLPEPSLLVYYWDGSVPEGRKIRDISITGAYVVTPERWYVGTIVRLILQGYKTTAQPPGGIVSSRSTSIPSRVIRHGPDGIGVEFLFSNPEERKEMEAFLTSIPLTRGHANGHVTSVDGRALLEFALILPLMFLLLVAAGAAAQTGIMSIFRGTNATVNPGVDCSGITISNNSHVTFYNTFDGTHAFAPVPLRNNVR